jgi:hypothetical protein
MTGTDKAIRWSTAAAVIGVATVAAVVSYEHAYALVHAHGETGWTAHIIPLTVDGLIWASSMVMLDSCRRDVPVPSLARWLLGLGIAATLAANVAHGLGHGLIGASVGAWPALALVGSYELLMMIIRGTQQAAGNFASETASSGRDAACTPGSSRRGVCRRCYGRPPAIDSRYTRETSRGAASAQLVRAYLTMLAADLEQSRERASALGNHKGPQRVCVGGGT